MNLFFNHTSKDETSYDSNKRSVYLPVIRNNLFDGFSLFDYTDASVPNGDRSTSTVATQSLYLMNSEFVVTASEALARRVLAESSSENVSPKQPEQPEQPEQPGCFDWPSDDQRHVRRHN